MSDEMIRPDLYSRGQGALSEWWMRDIGVIDLTIIAPEI